VMDANICAKFGHVTISKSWEHAKKRVIHQKSKKCKEL